MIGSSRLNFSLCLIIVTWLLAFWSIYLYFDQRHTSILLFSLVCLGTGYDFWGTISGVFVKNKKTNLFFARTRYGFANFGILFTPFTAIFILSEIQKRILYTPLNIFYIPYPNLGLSEWLVQHYFYFLFFSIFTGLPYFFSCYLAKEEKSHLIIEEDKSQRINFLALLLRRLILIISLLIAVIVAVDGFLIKKGLWAGLFLMFFLASAPLNILKKNISAMIVEVTTLIILFFGIKFYLISV